MFTGLPFGGGNGLCVMTDLKNPMTPDLAMVPKQPYDFVVTISIYKRKVDTFEQVCPPPSGACRRC